MPACKAQTESARRAEKRNWPSMSLQGRPADLPAPGHFSPCRWPRISPLSGPELVQVRGLHSFAGSRLGEPVALCAVGDHQGNAVAPGGLPKPAEAPGAPPVPLALEVGPAHLADPDGHPLVLARAGRAVAGGALIVRGRRPAQHSADRLDAEAAAMLIDQRAHFGRSASSWVAKKPRRPSRSRWQAEAQVLALRTLDLLGLLAGR
jgi:hypothetical protein